MMYPFNVTLLLNTSTLLTIYGSLYCMLSVLSCVTMSTVPAAHAHFCFLCLLLLLWLMNAITLISGVLTVKTEACTDHLHTLLIMKIIEAILKDDADGLIDSLNSAPILLPF